MPILNIVDWTGVRALHAHFRQLDERDARVTHPNQPPFTEHERVRGALYECAEFVAPSVNTETYEDVAFSELAARITPEGARKLVALLRL